MAVNSHPFDTELSNIDSAPPIVHTTSGVEVSRQCGFTAPGVAGVEFPLFVIQHSVAVVVDAVFFFLLFPVLAQRLLSMRSTSAMLMAMRGGKSW
ncbi:hypothetical protein FSB08_02540 [Paraburkholderia sp. JPY432]|uniref:hypothetical protein n=1 Tax=Paraburkholderia youngii TaxID=2782701 RepID=UPI001594FB6B|nr:hypothetical protein [Paraburkholderia youngii]NVH71453.1 hypothetical protein [Paraburkholderia youngii]